MEWGYDPLQCLIGLGYLLQIEVEVHPTAITSLPQLPLAFFPSSQNSFLFQSRSQSSSVVLVLFNSSLQLNHTQPSSLRLKISKMPISTALLMFTIKALDYFLVKVMSFLAHHIIQFAVTYLFLCVFITPDTLWAPCGQGLACFAHLCDIEFLAENLTQNKWWINRHHPQILSYAWVSWKIGRSKYSNFKKQVKQHFSICG